MVEPINSSLDVQVTLLSSCLISFKKFLIFSSIIFLNKKQRYLPFTGLEGFEPPSSGFGDRRSSR